MINHLYALSIKVNDGKLQFFDGIYSCFSNELTLFSGWCDGLEFYPTLQKEIRDDTSLQTNGREDNQIGNGNPAQYVLTFLT